MTDTHVPATGTPAATVTVTVRLFAGARAAADGVGEVCLATPSQSTVEDVLDRLSRVHPATARVLPACSFLLDGVRARLGDPVGRAVTLDVLPPFSGG